MCSSDLSKQQDTFDEEIVQFEDGRECINSITLNEFNTITNQLLSVEIYFDDEIRALIILASLPNSWEAMRMAVSNSTGKEKLKYNDIRDLILAEKIRRRDASETLGSGSALNLETRGRDNDRDSNQGKSKSRNSNRNRSKSRSGQQV